uniref:Uncharacterized protein n=1 Tax=Triticum urartu TaxID=4572 RepID=A0A8R7QA26_TRIUA
MNRKGNKIRYNGMTMVMVDGFVPCDVCSFFSSWLSCNGAKVQHHTDVDNSWSVGCVVRPRKRFGRPAIITTASNIIVFSSVNPGIGQVINGRPWHMLLVASISKSQVHSPVSRETR